MDLNQQWQHEFPQDPKLCYLNHAAVAPWPKRAADAVSAFARENLIQGARDYPRWSRTEKHLREQLKPLLNAPAASDIALVIDAMDILHSGRFAGFVLISSDSDFTRLASRIREQGVDVFGIGMRKTPAAFVKACKRFIYVENLISEPSKSKPKPKPQKEDASDLAPAPLEDPTKLVTRAMDAIDQDDEWFTLGQIGQYISAATPDFDTRSYGHKKLSDLVAAIKVLETRKDGNQLMVRRVD